MNKYPSRNVPVTCKLCTRPPQYSNTLYHPAIWRYNLDAHIRNKHPDHATPSNPNASFDIPKELWKNMIISEKEQENLDIPENIRFPSTFCKVETQ